MKRIPTQNVKLEHVIIDSHLHEGDRIPDGQVSLKLANIVLETQNGNHVMRHYYTRVM